MIDDEDTSNWEDDDLDGVFEDAEPVVYHRGAMQRMAAREDKDAGVRCREPRVDPLDRDFFALVNVAVDGNGSVHDTVGAALARAREIGVVEAIVQPCRIALPTRLQIGGIGAEILRLLNDRGAATQWSDFTDKQAIDEFPRDVKLLESMLMNLLAQWVNQGNVDIRAWKLRGVPQRFVRLGDEWTEPCVKYEHPDNGLPTTCEMRKGEYLHEIALRVPRGVYVFYYSYNHGGNRPLHLQLLCEEVVVDSWLSGPDPVSEFRTLNSGATVAVREGVVPRIVVRTSGELGSLHVRSQKVQ